MPSMPGSGPIHSSANSGTTVHLQSWAFSPCRPTLPKESLSSGQCNKDIKHKHILWETLDMPESALQILKALPSTTLGHCLAWCPRPRFPGSPEKNSGFLFDSTF